MPVGLRSFTQRLSHSYNAVSFLKALEILQVPLQILCTTTGSSHCVLFTLTLCCRISSLDFVIRVQYAFHVSSTYAICYVCPSHLDFSNSNNIT
jgi:hypothetical protein